MTDYKNKSKAELEAELRSKKESLRAFRFGMSGSKTKNVKEGRNLRKDVARIMTEMNKKQISN